MLGKRLKEALGIVRPRKCLVLCLYPAQPESMSPKQVLEALLKWSRERGLADPTWMQMDASGVNGRNLTFKTAYKKLAELERSQDIKELWLSCALPGVDDRFVGWSWAASLSPKTLDKSISVFFDVALDAVDISVAKDLATVLMQEAEIHYGFITVIPFYYGPYFWVSGMLYESGDGTMAMKEQERLSKWAHARVEASKLNMTLGQNYLRDVYEVNFLTDTHLSLPVKNGTLREWIEASKARGVILQLKTGLYCWTVSDKGLSEARAVLGNSLHLVCYGDYAVKSGGPYGPMYPY